MSFLLDKYKVVDLQYIVDGLKETSTWKLILGGSVLIFGSYMVFFKRDNSPPGPMGFPVIGILPFIDRSKPHFSFIKLAEKYGDICSFSLMRRNIVLVSGEKNIYDVYVHRQDEFSDRINSVRVKTIMAGTDDFAMMNDGEKFRDLKKISLRSLKAYGEGMERVERISNEVIDTFIEYLSKNKGKSLDLKQKLKIVFCDIIMSMTLNKKVDSSAMDEFVSISDQISECMLDPRTAVLEIFPWLRHFNIGAFKQLKNLAAKRDTALKPILKERLKTFNPNNIATVMEDAWNLMLQSKFDYGENDLYALQRVMIIAGFITTSTTFYNLFPVLIAHKHIVDRIYQEIKDNIGLDRMPKLEDRLNMPYTEATILEAHRFLSIIPLSLPHVAAKDCYMGGYKIKKGSSIFPNIWGLHHDKKIWGDPENFRPDRFLDVNGQLFSVEHKLRRCVLPFGAGRRVCIGKNLANNRLFLFLTSVIQKFTFYPENDKEIDWDPINFKYGIVITHQPYKLYFEERIN